MNYVKMFCLAGIIVTSALSFSLAEKKKEFKQRPLIVDVSTPWEFKQKHFPGAINIPSEEIGENIKKFGSNKNRAIIVYCAGGVRSEEAKDLLKGYGFKNVKNGGTLDEMLKKKNDPEKKDGPFDTDRLSFF